MFVFEFFMQVQSFFCRVVFVFLSESFSKVTLDLYFQYKVFFVALSIALTESSSKAPPQMRIN